MLSRHALLLALTAAASAKECLNVTVPVQITSRNGVFDLIAPQTDLEANVFALNQTQQGRNFSATVLTGYADVSGEYNISAKYCTPGNGTTPDAIQILTHGIGFDKTYWDLSFNNYNYSYINTALKSGYATLSYDRLGIGNSSHGEPVNEIQSFLEVEALRSLTQQLRDGTFPQVKKQFSKVIHVGHSFGSAQTYSLTNLYPDLSDGVVLTGFSTNSSFLPYFVAAANFVQARNNQPLRFGNINAQQVQEALAAIGLDDTIAGLNLDQETPSQDLPPGYIISSNAEANQYLFLYPGAYDPEILKVAENTKQPVTIGEILTLGSVPMMSQFTKPVLVFTGEYDLPFCGGDCLATGSPDAASIPAAASMAFPSVDPSDFLAYIQPGTGHGLNTHYNATEGYEVIQTFLASKGL